jgi:hypothetical protein
MSRDGAMMWMSTKEALARNGEQEKKRRPDARQARSVAFEDTAFEAACADEKAGSTEKQSVVLDSSRQADEVASKDSRSSAKASAAERE